VHSLNELQVFYQYNFVVPHLILCPSSLACHSLLHVLSSSQSHGDNVCTSKLRSINTQTLYCWLSLVINSISSTFLALCISSRSCYRFHARRSSTCEAHD